MSSGGCYERGLTGSMAEDGTELEALEAQLHLLLAREPPRGDGRGFCSDFCTLVEQHASRWQLPLPQLRVLQVALCYFTQASVSLMSNCEHVLNTTSSLALSIFELLLFFEQKDFEDEPLRIFSATFQECHSVLSRLQNVHLLQVEHAVRRGGPWSNPVLQAILTESSLPQNEVDGCIDSELPVFFELRVLYLLSSQRVTEAMALARCCARHPAAGRHAFFLQVYLTWLYKTSQHERLRREVAVFNGKDAVHIVCSLEHEEEDELLLALCTAFLSEQLRRGDLYYLCDLVLVWTKLHSRLKTPKQALLAESRQLMLSATNISSIFPFIRAVLQETGEAGIQFCVELCANALQSCLPCDAATKALIYKTIAGLLPGDLEVCRACALLVFFLERSVEAYKMVYLLYLHPDQEYHVDCCPIGNHVRFETLQILKKDLCFDPEFWNLITLRTSCLKLMSEKVVSAALEEIMEDKWISSYCTKESALTSACRRQKRREFQVAEKKRHHRDADATSKRLKVEHAGRKKSCQASRLLTDAPSEPLRRSFWQLDRLRDNGEHRRTTRLSEKSMQKRRIRTPRWLLEDSGTLENNVPLKIKKHGLREQKQQRSSIISRSQSIPFKNSVRLKPAGSLEGKTRENGLKHLKGLSLDGVKAAPAPQVVLELSLPDNELLFTEDAFSRQRGLPQVLLYKPTVKLLAAAQPTKTAHGKEVILRARDAAMLVQQLHCYARKQKGKGVGANAHGSVSTITRSSVQGSPPKDPPQILETKDGESPPAPAAGPVLRKLSSAREISEKSTAKGAGALKPDCEEPAVEMKVTIASPSPVLERVCKAAEDQVSPSSMGDESPPALDKVTNTADAEGVAPEGGKGGEGEQKPLSPDLPEVTSRQDSKDSSSPETDQKDSAALTPVSEMIQQLPPEQLSTDLDHKREDSGNCASEESTSPLRTPSTSSCPIPDQEVSLVDGRGSTQDSSPAIPDDEEPDSEPETEESKLEYCCTFCTKDFKGRRVVEHAMFHYRRDECMFCGVAFKDDLLAMMHLSDHIEKLKRLKETPGNKVKAKGLANTKDTSTVRSFAKAQPGNVSQGRPRKSSVCPKPSKARSPPELKRSKSRTLRSSNKPVDEKQPTVPRLNGHRGRRKELKRLKHNLKAKISQEITSDGVVNHNLRKHKDLVPPELQLQASSEDRVKTPPSPQVPVTSAKQTRGEAEETACCPVDGCSWSTELSKNRVALLYHALEDHHGDVEPLKLAFSRGDGKCTVCMRVLWSFEHFCHHVERHRLTPRHPCLHQGCTARFKTGMEMRRHTRKHSPLQAVCCLPGCSRLFICLWALNLHERGHYARKSRDTNVKSTDGHGNSEKGLNVKHPSSDRTERPRHHLPRDKPHTSKDDQSKNPNVLKNLSNKDASTETAAPPQRLRLRKATNTSPKVHKVISSLMKRCKKVRSKLKKQQVAMDKGPRKRGRPPKNRRDENTQGLRETVTHTDQKRPDKEGEDRARPKVQGPGELAEPRLRRAVKTSHVKEELESSSSSHPYVAAPEHRMAKPDAAPLKKPHTHRLRGTTRKVHRNHWLSSAVKPPADVLQSEEKELTEPGDAKAPVSTTTEDPKKPPVSTTFTEESKKPPVSTTSTEECKKLLVSTTSTEESKKLPVLTASTENNQGRQPARITAPLLQYKEKEEEPTEPGDTKLPVLATSTENNQGLQSEDKHDKLPVLASTTEKSNNLPVLTSTTENNQSPLSDKNPIKVPVPRTKKKPNKLPVLTTTVKKPRSVQTGDKHRKSPVPPTSTEKSKKSLVPPATQKPQSLQSDKATKKVHVLLTSMKKQSGQSEDKPDKPAVPTTMENNQDVHPEEKPRKVPVPTTTTEKAKKVPIPTTIVKKTKSVQSGDRLKKHPVPPTVQKCDRPRKPRSKKENPPSDTRKRKKLKKQANKKPAKEEQPNKDSVPSKCEVKQEDGAGEGAVGWSPPEDGGKAMKSKAVNNCLSSKVRKKRKVLHKDDRTAVKKQRGDGCKPSESRKNSECEGSPQVLQEVQGEVEHSSSSERPPQRTPAIRGRGAIDGNFSVCKETLEKYRKKPYLRLPPTVYLHEKYTTMPKRRKEVSSSSPEPEASSPLPMQRHHRCPNCFTTFHCDQELQKHLTLNKCSTFFGFDSDNDD